MSAALAAAHVGHEIEHSAALWGFIAGAVVGLAVGVLIVAATVATGGAALAVVAAVGGAIAATGGMALAGKYIGEAIVNPSGPISTGSTNVRYGPVRMPAARAVEDLVGCKNHGPKRIATGSDSVFINGFPAARRTDKTECDGTVGSDLDHIFIGAETAQYLEIESEVPEWLVQIAEGMVLVGTAVALVFGAAAAVVAGGICGLIGFGGTVAGGFLGGIVGAGIGGVIGEALGGELGRRIGEVGGGLLGGVFGARLGNRFSTGHPVDVATGELFTQQTDFTLPGMIPVVWERFWISSSTQRNGALGAGWHHPFDLAAVETTDTTLLRLEHGRLIELPRLSEGESFYHRAEKLVVLRRHNRFELRDESGLARVLESSPVDPGRFRLTAIMDFNGNALRLAYDAQGWLSRVDTCEGIALIFGHDAHGRITEISRVRPDLRETLVRYDYDVSGALIRSVDAAGATFTYGYQGGLLCQETRPNGLSFYFEWDDLARGIAARCIKTWGDGGIYYREIQYNIDDHSTNVRDGAGGDTRFGWNMIGLVTHVTTALGHKASTEYNVYAEVTAETNAENSRAESIRDDFGRLIAAVDPAGHATRFVWASDAPESPVFFALASVTDATGAETSYHYDVAGNMIATTDPLGETVTYLRDAQGRMISGRDDLGTFARFRWSTEGWLVEERNSKGGQHLYEHDGFGRIIAETVEKGGTTRFVWRSGDRLSNVIYPDGAETILAHDVEGNLVAFTDPEGRRTEWHYGGLPFPLRRTNADGSIFEYRYDGELNLTHLRNESGDVYTLVYNAENRLVEEIGFDGRRQEFQYSPAGYLLHSRDGHREHKFLRDPLGNMLRRDSSDGDWSSFGYDRLGRITAAANPQREIGFTYDPRGLLLSETQDDHVLAHGYNLRGQRSHTMLPDGRRISFDYDQNGDFSGLRFMEREVLTIRRDRLGREVERQTTGLSHTSEYDPQGRLLRQSARRSGIADPIFARRYHYDRSGNVNGVDDAARGGLRMFRYDAREQLRAVTGGKNEIFSFDPAGNLLLGVDRAGDASVQSGRLLMQGDNHFSYDDAGNRIRAERGWGGIIATDYEYDHQNQLTAVIETSPGRRKVTRFAYDALGRRISKSNREEKYSPLAANAVPSPDPAPPPISDELTVFLWNGDVLLSEGSAPAGVEPDPLAVVYAFEPESFLPVAQIRRHSRDQEGQVLLYWLDHLGTPQELTNEAGELVWQVALKAWGGIDRIQVETVPNNLRFQGQYHDVETGLHYNRFRHYDPDTGAFINQDPIGLLGGEVLSAYAPNPIAWLDPLGLNRWNDYLRDNPGQTPAEAARNYRALYPPPPATTGSVHGNSLSSTRPTVGYIIRENGTGRILKFGETSNPVPQRRYTEQWYKANNAYMDPVKAGTKAEMHKWQSDRIRQYEKRHTVKPPLNKCYY